MASAAQKREVMTIIDSMESEIVQTVSELVQIRSVNPGYPGVDHDAELGGETEANNYLVQKYRELGLEEDMWEEAAGRANLVGVWKGAGGGKSLEHFQQSARPKPYQPSDFRRTRNGAGWPSAAHRFRGAAINGAD